MPKISPDRCKWFVDLCLQRFGSMNKNDYEVALFHLLLENGCRDKSDFEMSKIMRIPESKVKRLHYESNLVYASEDDLDGRLKALLEKQNFKQENGRLYILIKDKMLRQYANDLLESKDYFADGSFRTEIISLTATDFLALMCILYGKENYMKRVYEIQKHLVAANKPLPQTVSENIKNGVKNLIEDMVSTYVPNLAEFVKDNVLGKASIPTERISDKEHSDKHL